MADNPKVCPKCHKAMLDENEDGDLECINCGKIVYKDEVPIANKRVIGVGGYKRRYKESLNGN